MNNWPESFDLLNLKEAEIELNDFRIKLITDLYIKNECENMKNNEDFSEEEPSLSDEG